MFLSSADRDMFGRKLKSGLVAVMVSPKQIDIVGVDRPNGRDPVIMFSACYPCDTTVIETLAHARRELHLQRFPCTTLLGSADYELQVLDAPSVPAEELREAVRWRLKDVLDYPAEEATLDVFSLLEDQMGAVAGASIFAVVAKSDLIAARMGAFAEAKVPLRVIDIPEMAQRNISTLFEAEGNALAMLSFDERRGLLTFTVGGELYLARSVDIGLSELLFSAGEVRDRLFERIALELQRSLDHFDRQFSRYPVSTLMLAPMPEDLDLRSYLSDSVYVPVENAGLDGVIDFSGAPELSAGSIPAPQFLAIGAALRQDTAS